MSRKTTRTTTTGTTPSHKGDRAAATTKAAYAAAASMFEPLEDRKLFSMLTVDGTAGDDMIRLTQRGHVLTVAVNNTTKNVLAARLDGIVVNGLAGNDKIQAAGYFTIPLTLNGGAGNDFLTGGRANDSLNGDDGNDTFYCSPGADDVHGGNGGDTADYSTCTTSLNVSLDDVANDGRAGENDNVHSDVENLVGGYGNDTLTGSAESNYIQGAGGTDTIRGLDGNDTLDGGIGGSTPVSRNNGNDVLWGGDGQDTLHASDYGANELYGEGGNDVLWGYNGADKLYGASGQDWLFGGNNNDELYGGTGDDYCDGQAGNDKVYGNSGPQRFIITLPPGPIFGGISDGTSNTVLFSEAGATEGGATISPRLPVIDPIQPIDPTLPPPRVITRVPLPDELQIDPSVVWLPPVQIVETDNDIIYGGAGNDRMRGDAGNDQVNGDEGNDVLYGDAGNDLVHGNAGNDRLYGGAGDDDLFGDENDDILVSIGGGQNDENTGGDGFDSVWCDAEVSETDNNDFWGALFEGLAGTHHRVAGFEQLRTSNVDTGATIATQTPSRELNGQNLLDPIGSGTIRNFSDRPLFAPGGPSPDDVNQGAIGDCYYLSGLSSTARVGANHIQQAVVDLGDGTYAMRFYKDGAETYYRVDGDLLTSGVDNPTYADLGTADSIWVPIMEKVFTFARSNAGTFASIHGGSGAEPFNAMNMSSHGVSFGATAHQTLVNIKAELDAGYALVASTPNANPTNGCPCVKWHLYSIVSVNLGTDKITLRNPWGTDGGGNSDGSNDGYVTVTASQFHGYFNGIRAGVN